MMLVPTLPTGSPTLLKLFESPILSASFSAVLSRRNFARIAVQILFLNHVWSDLDNHVSPLLRFLLRTGDCTTLCSTQKSSSVYHFEERLLAWAAIACSVGLRMLAASSVRGESFEHNQRKLRALVGEVQRIDRGGREGWGARGGDEVGERAEERRG